MLVRVDMVERQAGRGEGGELLDLGESWRRAAGLAKIVMPAGRRAGRGPCRSGKWPVVSTSSRPARRERGPARSTRTTCRPTPSLGMVLARATASAKASPETIRLAAVRIPSRWACSTGVVDRNGSTEIVGGDNEAPLLSRIASP